MKEKPTIWQRVVKFFSGFFKGRRSAPSVSRSARNGAVVVPKSRGGEVRQEAGGGGVGTLRKPDLVEVTSPRVYVGNLSYDATESDLHELFSGVGQVRNVEIVTSKHNQRSKGFGFVQMETIEEARRAVEALHDREYMGRKLVVSGAKALDERRSSRTSEQPQQ